MIRQTIPEGATVYSDEGGAFMPLKEYGYRHETVVHGRREYVRGPVHTNTIEAFWLLVKRGISGTYVWCSQRHLQNYLNEFEFRWNLRKDQHLMFPLLMSAFAPPRRWVEKA